MPWIDVLATHDVPPGATAPVELPGVDLVVWRSATGVLAACDSRCPHQWSHLAGAGVVDGEELVCLSHFWRFDAEGRGSKVSMAGRRDPKSEVVAFAIREVDGRIEVEVPGAQG
jgi:phenylpropionate dioxygenase-like ring-hydroxylating dioxygenase large terminal subunit